MPNTKSPRIRGLLCALWIGGAAAAPQAEFEAEFDHTTEGVGTSRWDIETRYRDEQHKLSLLSEGDYSDGDTTESRLQILYSRSLSTAWSGLVGLRRGFEPRTLDYLSLSVRGLAPYRTDSEAFFYFSEDGDTSAEVEFEKPFALAQRLTLKPFLELDLLAQDRPELGKASGLTEGELGLRLLYALRRGVLPYAEFSYTRLAGETADIARGVGEPVSENTLWLGIKLER